MQTNEIILLITMLIIFIGIPIIISYYILKKRNKPQCKKHWSNWIEIDNGSREVRTEIAEGANSDCDEIKKEYRFTQKFIDSAKNKYQLDGNIQESTLKNEDETLKDLVQSRFEAEKNNCKRGREGKARGFR